MSKHRGREASRERERERENEAQERRVKKVAKTEHVTAPGEREGMCLAPERERE